MARPEKKVVKFIKDTPDGIKKGDAFSVYPTVAADLFKQGFIEDYRPKKEPAKNTKK